MIFTDNNTGCDWCYLSEEDKEFLLYEGEQWNVFLADKQDYIGRCILVLKRHCASLSELNALEWNELKAIIQKVETAITASLGATLFNWGCMMNDFYKSDVPDPHLHIHVRPRYKFPVEVNGVLYADEEFAHHYDNHKADKLTDEEKRDVYQQIKKAMEAIL